MSRGELRELAADAVRDLDPDDVDALLHDAIDCEDALEANGSHWVMRTGRFATAVYDHPSTGEWRKQD
ncbi:MULTISPECIES: hypothetical protein [Haloferacaceae]|uniref:Halobacterial output domain-containing protein n=1 Tax=Halorubrum glutamatedens TaxID=2707018 RepID=A0ABD5QWM0_9EURY|nr:hypothetical protein [Halobellus captivus]